MIHIFYGTDRVAAEKAAEKILYSGAEKHETIDAEDLGPADFPTIFLGTTLFESSRRILIKDFFTTKDRGEELLKYLDTPHEIVIISDKFNKTPSYAKKLAAEKTRVEIREFKLPEMVDKFLSFNVFDEAMMNGQRAVEKLRKAEDAENPYAMIGAWASKAMKNYAARPSAKNKRVLKELAKIDLMLKSTNFANKPWPVLELFLLRLKDL